MTPALSFITVPDHIFTPLTDGWTGTVSTIVGCSALVLVPASAWLLLVRRAYGREIERRYERAKLSGPRPPAESNRIICQTVGTEETPWRK